MPTDCEPWPGKTKANGVITQMRRPGAGPLPSPAAPPRGAANEVRRHRASSVVEERRAPGEAAADALEQHRVAALDLARTHRFVERQRHRCSRRVAVPVDGGDELFGSEL